MPWMCYASFIPIFLARYHLTIKKNLKEQGKRMHLVLETLLVIAKTRLVDNEKKTLELSVKTPTVRLSPLLEALRARLTPHAWSLVEQEAKKTKTSYTLIEVTYIVMIATH